MRREKFFVVATAFFLSLMELKLKLAVTSTYFDGTLASNHARLLAFQYTNNEQSRLLQFYVPEAIHWIFGASVPHAYEVQRFGFVFLGFVAFHFYLRRWFKPLEAFAGVALLAAWLPMTYLNDLQESCSLLFLTFTLALWMIRENNALGFMLAMCVGALNNETILVLSAAYFFVNLKQANARAALETFGKTALLTAPAWLATFLIRYITRNQPHLGGAYHLEENLNGIVNGLKLGPFHWHTNWYLGVFFLFGALWYFAFAKLREKPQFLLRASLCVPLFLAAHLLTGILFEIRQMIPLAAILIPMAFFYLRPQSA